MIRAAVLLLAAAAAAGPQAAERQTVADLQGKLYRSAFSSGPDGLEPSDLAGVPEPLRARLATYLARRDAFRTGYKQEATSWEMVRTHAKKRALERAIVSLLDLPGIEKTAAAFVADAPISYEWEGMPGGPLDEARHAEDVLKSDPSSPLAPWLYVFIAQRQRAAFEMYEHQRNESGMKAAAKKYRVFAERARSAEDRIFAALMDDMDAQPYLYVKTAHHPRSFNPDA